MVPPFRKKKGKFLPFNPADLVKTKIKFYFFFLCFFLGFFFANTASITDNQRWYFFQAVYMYSPKNVESDFWFSLKPDGLKGKNLPYLQCN